MKELVNKLNYATKMYDEGHPIMSDKEWDDLYFQLEAMEKELGIILPNSPTNKVDFQVVNELKKVAHNHPMLSLAKTKDIKEIEKFIGGRDYVAMCKMDGLTCSLHYVDGDLVGAETRGNGEVGEDILHNAMVMKSIPKHLPFKQEYVIDGEIICTYNDFAQFSNDYQNPRNFAAGSCRLLDSKECAKRNLTFVAWDMVKGHNGNSLLGKLRDLEDFFITVPYLANFHITSLESAFNSLQASAKSLGYPIDGIVVKYDDMEYYESLGYTDHHFRGGIAYKFYDETVDTNLIDIEWTMGKTGILTPVAIFNPVQIDGTTVQKASLHNVSILDEMLGEPFVGQKLKVFKANMIIPQIYSAYKGEGQKIKFPDVCPYCGERLEVVESEAGVKVLSCTNNNCKNKLVEKLEVFCSKEAMNIEGISTATLQMFVDCGWVEKLSDVFRLVGHKDEWKNKEGFSEYSVTKLLEAIDNGRKNKTLSQLLYSLSIPLVGNRYAKIIAEHFKTWDAFKQAVSNNYDFTQLKGIGEKMSKNILNFDYTDGENIFSYLTMKEDVKPTTGKLSGMKFVITGSLNQFSNRKALENYIEENGGEIQSGVNKDTTYLINNDVESTSSKNKKAKELGIKIISESQFLDI